VARQLLRISIPSGAVAHDFGVKLIFPKVKRFSKDILLLNALYNMSLKSTLQNFVSYGPLDDI